MSPYSCLGRGVADYGVSPLNNMDFQTQAPPHYLTQMNAPASADGQFEYKL